MAVQGQSTWAGPYAFTTLCLETPDYTEDFTTFLNSCWTEATGPITGPTAFSGASWAGHNFGNTGSNTAAMFNIYATGGDDWLMTPLLMDLTGGGFEINLDAALTPWTGTASSTIEVGDAVYVMQSIDGGATWTTIYTWDNGNSPSNTGDNLSIDVTAVTSATTQFAIFVLEDATSGGDYRFYIDNFKVRTQPSCAAPTALTATSITSTGASLGWTENGTATTWDIEWGATGFTQGAGTIDTSSNPKTLSGLTANTSYDFYVRADCGGSTSAWVGPYTFTTQPGAHTIPLSEGFETGFANFDNALGNDVDWTISTTYFHTGAQSMHNAHGSSNENIAHETGILDLSGTTAAIIEFWHIAKTEGAYDKCYVEISTDGGATYTALPNAAYQGTAGDYDTRGYFHEDSYGTWGTGTQTPDNATWWQKEKFSLAAYNVANVRVRFKVTSDGGGNRAGWYVDDILIFEPTCPDPSALTATTTATSANLGWTEAGTATTWDIEYGAAGFTATGTPTVTGTTTNPHNIMGLSANTSYDFYVRADCGGSGTSNWVGPFTFTTTTNPVTVPYMQDFEAGSLVDFGTSTGGDASVALDAGSNCAGTNALFFTGGSSSGFTGGSTSATATQAWNTNTTKQAQSDLVVDATAVTAFLILDFDLKQEYSYGNKYSWFRVLVNGTQVSADFNATTQNSDPCAMQTIDLSAYKGTTFTLTFQSSMKYDDARGSSGQGDNAFLDNIKIREVSCLDPSALMASNITGTSADLGWTENGTATTWDIEYGTAGFMPTGTPTITGTTTNPHSLTTLADYTSYDYYVRADCGGANGASAWVGPYTFTTTCSTPLTGTYTIGASGDYTSFASAADALASCGISGPVTFNVMAGTYTEGIELPVITGSSMTNTITFDGMNAATIDYDAGSGQNAIVLMNGADYVTFKNFTFNHSKTVDAWGFRIINESDFLTIENNTFNMGTGTSDVVAVAATGSATSATTEGDHCENLTVNNNTIIGGSDGIRLEGRSATADFMNYAVLTNNTISQMSKQQVST